MHTQHPALMQAFGAESAVDYMVTVITRIKSSQPEEVLLVLPLDMIQELVSVLEMKHSWVTIKVRQRKFIQLLFPEIS